MTQMFEKKTFAVTLFNLERFRAILGNIWVGMATISFLLYNSILMTALVNIWVNNYKTVTVYKWKINIDVPHCIAQPLFVGEYSVKFYKSKLLKKKISVAIDCPAQYLGLFLFLKCIQIMLIKTDKKPTLQFDTEFGEHLVVARCRCKYKSLGENLNSFWLPWPILRLFYWLVQYWKFIFSFWKVSFKYVS